MVDVMEQNSRIRSMSRQMKNAMHILNDLCSVAEENMPVIAGLIRSLMILVHKSVEYGAHWLESTGRLATVDR